jgi:hypothetical protein
LRAAVFAGAFGSAIVRSFVSVQGHTVRGTTDDVAMRAIVPQ